MRLSFVTSNILHQVLEWSEINIVYNPTNTLFDKILYHALPTFNFFVFNPDYVSSAENCLGVPESHVELYNYDLIIANSILDTSRESLSRTLHANTVIFQHDNKNPKIKKEDLIILNNKTQSYHKVFFSNHKSAQWGGIASSVIPYGIPQDIFKKQKEYSDRTKDILIISAPNNIGAKQLSSFIKDRYEVIDIIESKDYQNLNLNEINNKINDYRVIVNLADYDLMNLVGISCGCNVLTLANLDKPTPYISTCSSAKDIVEKLENIQEINQEDVKTYLETNYSFSLFKLHTSQLIQAKAKQEAYIL